MNTAESGVHNPALEIVQEINAMDAKIKAFNHQFGPAAAFGRWFAGTVGALLGQPEEHQDNSKKDSFSGLSKSLGEDKRAANEYLILASYLKDIESTAKKLGLVVLSDFHNSGGIMNFSEAKTVELRFDVADMDIFELTIKHLSQSISEGPDNERAEAREKLVKLMELIRNNICLFPSGEALAKSKSIEAVARVSHLTAPYDSFSHQAGDFFRGVSEEVDTKQRERDLDLFLDFQKNISGKIFVLGTGDASLDYIKQTNKIFQEWLAKGQTFNLSPSTVVYMEECKASFLAALNQYVEKHQQWREKNPQLAIDFASADEYAKNLINNSQAAGE